MTLRRAYGSYTISGQEQDMVYGPRLHGSCPRGSRYFIVEDLGLGSLP